MSGKRFRNRVVRVAGLMVGIGAVAVTVAANRPESSLPERPLAVSVDVEPGAGVAAAGAGPGGTAVAGELEPGGAALRGRVGLGSRRTVPGRYVLEVDPGGGRASVSALRRAGVAIRIGGGAGPVALDPGGAEPIALDPGETDVVPVSVRLERRDDAAPGSPPRPDRLAIRLRPRQIGATQAVHGAALNGHRPSPPSRGNHGAARPGEAEAGSRAAPEPAGGRR